LAAAADVYVTYLVFDSQLVEDTRHIAREPVYTARSPLTHQKQHWAVRGRSLMSTPLARQQAGCGGSSVPVAMVTHRGRVAVADGKDW